MFPVKVIPFVVLIGFLPSPAAGAGPKAPTLVVGVVFHGRMIGRPRRGTTIVATATTATTACRRATRRSATSLGPLDDGHAKCRALCLGLLGARCRLGLLLLRRL